jgi:RNA polymerase sigma-70 factor (ECF subfamily)
VNATDRLAHDLRLPTGGRHLKLSAIRAFASGERRPTLNATPSDADLLRRILQRDTAAFRLLVERHHAAMLRLARVYTRNPATAEETVQDAWVAIIEGIARFEGRSSLKTWMLAIVANKARQRGGRDGLVILLDDLPWRDDGIDASRFDERGHWRDPPGAWDMLTPEILAGDRELLQQISLALDRLPPAQRAVVLLRDVEGIDTAAACNILGISETNLRVLLHRARTRLRSALSVLLSPRERLKKVAGC